MQNTIIKTFENDPRVTVAIFDEGGRNGETYDWVNTFWSNYYLRGTLLWDATGVDARNYGQPITGLPFGRGFIIDEAGNVSLPYFGHRPQMVIRTIRGMVGHIDGSGTTRPGDPVALTLSATRDAGLNYQVGSSLGTGPIPIDTRNLGLSADSLLWMSVSGVFPAVFQGYGGVIKPDGTASAVLGIPPVASLVGISIHSAFVTVDRAAPSGIRTLSNTFSFTIG